MEPQLKLVEFNEDKKKCGDCKEIKFKTEFYKNNARGYQHYCKKCSAKRMKEVNRKHYLKNKESKLRINRRWLQSETGKIHTRNRIWKKQGIKNADGTWFRWENYLIKIAEQKNMCAICNTNEPPNNGGQSKWHVDHNHSTGIVRWVLCFQCNHLLGCAKDNPEILEKAAKMLREKKS